MDLSHVPEKFRKVYILDLAIQASIRRNALVGIKDVVTKKEWITDPSFTADIQTRIEAQEIIILSCYREITKDDEADDAAPKTTVDAK